MALEFKDDTDSQNGLKIDQMSEKKKYYLSIYLC